MSASSVLVIFVQISTLHKKVYLIDKHFVKRKKGHFDRKKGHFPHPAMLYKLTPKTAEIVTTPMLLPFFCSPMESIQAKSQLFQEDEGTVCASCQSGASLGDRLSVHQTLVCC